MHNLSKGQYNNTHITLEFTSTVDIVNKCNAGKEQAIERSNNEC